MPLPDDWRRLWGRVPRLVGQTNSAQRFGPYQFTGNPLIFVSSLSQLLGRLAGETRTGEILMPVFAQPIPESIVKHIDTESHLLHGFNRITDRNSIRNRIVIPYTAGIGVRVAEGEDVTAFEEGFPTSHRTPSTTYRGSVTLPDPPEGTLYSEFDIEIISAYGTAVAEVVNGVIRGFQQVDVTDFLNAAVDVDGLTANALISSSLPNATLEWSYENVTRTIEERPVAGDTSTVSRRAPGTYPSKAAALAALPEPTCPCLLYTSPSPRDS